MGVFQYVARDEASITTRGTLVADTPRQARDKLRAKGLRVADLTEQAVVESQWRLMSGSRVRAATITHVIRELSTLTSVGVPIVEAIDTVVQQHRGAVRTTLLTLKDRVAAGGSLADAMREQPGAFDELTSQMVEVGENSGNLDVVLRQLAEFKDRSLQLKDRVVGALVYPSIVFLTSITVTVFLMTVVVPMLLSNLVEAGRTLPWPTVVLKTLSEALVGYWPILVSGVFLVGIGVVAIANHPKGRHIWHKGLLRIPILGDMIRKQEVARLSIVMAALLRSGMVYLRALEIATRTTRNVVMRKALRDSSESVTSGTDISGALAATGVFPPVVVQVFKVGQETGQLEDLLDRLASDYDRQVSSLASRFASVLEPVLILGLAVFVGFILFATLLPILEAGNVF